jgi:hypothetical protein
MTHYAFEFCTFIIDSIGMNISIYRITVAAATGVGIMLAYRCYQLQQEIRRYDGIHQSDLLRYERRLVTTLELVRAYEGLVQQTGQSISTDLMHKTLRAELTDVRQKITSLGDQGKRMSKL